MNFTTVRKVSARNGEGGAILIMTAVGMLTFFMFVALAVDVSHWYLVRTELQNATDAAALSGAFSLDSTLPDGGVEDATTRAVQVLNRNKYGMNTKSFVPGENPTQEELDVLRQYVTFSEDLECGALPEGETDPYYCYVSENDADEPGVGPTIRFIRVQTPPVPTTIFFGSILTAVGNSINLGAEAIAGKSVSVTNLCSGWVPLAAATNDGCTLAEGEEPITFNPEDVGKVYTIKLDPHDQVSPGNMFALRFNDDSGADDLRTAIAAGVDGCISLDDPGDVPFDLSTETGNMYQPIRQGFNTRFDLYEGPMNNKWDSYPPDQNVKGNPNQVIDPSWNGRGSPRYITVPGPALTYADYIASLTPGDPKYHSSSYYEAPTHTVKEDNKTRREFIMPIVRTCEFGNGQGPITPRGFARFFLQKSVEEPSGVDKMEIKAEFIQGGIDGGGGGNANNQIVIPVLYR